MHTFNLHRKGVVFVVVALFVEALLLLLIGWILGSSCARRAEPGPEAPGEAAGQEEAASQAPAAASGSDATGSEASSPAAQTAPAAAASEEPPEDFTLRLGAYFTEEQVAAMVADLEQRGYPTYLEKIKDSRGRVVTEVRSGHYPTYDEASDAAEAYRLKEGNSATAVSAR